MIFRFLFGWGFVRYDTSFWLRWFVVCSMLIFMMIGCPGVLMRPQAL